MSELVFLFSADADIQAAYEFHEAYQAARWRGFYASSGRGVRASTRVSRDGGCLLPSPPPTTRPRIPVRHLLYTRGAAHHYLGSDGPSTRSGRYSPKTWRRQPLTFSRVAAHSRRQTIGSVAAPARSKPAIDSQTINSLLALSDAALKIDSTAGVSPHSAQDASPHQPSVRFLLAPLLPT